MLLRFLRRLLAFGRGPSDGAAAPARDQAALLAQLRQEHERTRDEAHGEVGAVLAETERATLAISGELHAIVSAAQTFVAEIKGRLGSLQDDREGGVSATLARQCELVTCFLDDLRGNVQLQREATARTLATAHKVQAAAASVAQISVASRVLCINTMIEAGRLGDAGQPMIVIADQMRMLSEQIRRSNEEISTAIAALLPTLDEVGASSALVDGRAAAFSSEFEVQAEEVGGIAAELRATAHAALASGDERLATVVSGSHRAIQSLQTQDIVSQRLRRVLQVLDRSGAHIEHPGSPTAADAERPDVYLSEAIGGEAQRELVAGDVLMF